MKKALLLVLLFVSGFTHYVQAQCSDLVISAGEPGRGHVGELLYYDIRPGTDWGVPIHWTALSMPPGVDTTSTQFLFKFQGSPSEPGTFTYSVAASSSTGCHDTLSFTRTYTCFPEGVWQISPGCCLEHAEVGVPYSQGLSMPDNGYELTGFKWTIVSGALPPGLSFAGNGYSATINGTATAEGNYVFTISTMLGSCLIFQNNYSIKVTPTGCADMQITSDYYGAEYSVGDTVKVKHFVSEDDAGPFTFEGIDLPPGSTLSSTGQLVFRPDHAASYSYSIRVTDTVGCSAIFAGQVTVMCFPVALGEATFNGLKKGVYFEAPVPIAERMHPPFTDFVGYGMPPGLSVSSSGIISGTPTSYGNFPYVPIGYKGLGGCPGTTNVTFNIQNNQPVKTLYFYSQCAAGDSVRNWKVHNQNSFNVNVTWSTLYFTTYQGSFVAAPGDNYFASPVTGGPNTVRITWQDENNTAKSLVQPANNNLCNPPACVTGVSVDFYHQGQKRDGTHVQPEVSNPSASLGEPDANDGTNNASKAFSLGFDGFIVIQLNANLSDMPGKDLTVYEYSPANPSFSNNPERAEVFASQNGVNWVSLGVTSPTDCHEKMDTQFDLAGKLPWCRYIKVLDVSNRNARVLNASTCAQTNALAFNGASNGFDLDAITCAGGSNNAVAARKIEMNEFGSRSGSSPFYPNPAVDIVTVDFSLDQDFVYPDNGEVEITLIDMSGSSVYRGNHILDDQWTTTCDVSNLNSGLFLARVNTGSSSRVYKFVKK